MLYIELPEGAIIKKDSEGYCIIELSDGSQIKAAEAVYDYLNGRASCINIYPSCPNEDKSYLEYLERFVTKDTIEKPALHWTTVNGKEKNAFLSRVSSTSCWHTQAFLSQGTRQKVEDYRAEIREDRRTKGPKSV